MFTHLHVHSSFSFLDGGSSVQALVERAAACGYRALALTDTNGLYGAVRFHIAATAAGLQPILGAEMILLGEEWDRVGAWASEPSDRSDPSDPSDHTHTPTHPHTHTSLTLLARNRTGFKSLCRLITEAQVTQEKGKPRLTLEMLRRRNEGLFCLSGGEHGPVAAPWLAGRRTAARQAAAELKEIFGPDRFFIEVQHLLHPHSVDLLRELTALAAELGLRTVATNSVHYARKEDFPVHDTLNCVRTLTTLDERHPSRKRNAEYYLKSPRAMQHLFRGYEAALEATEEIVSQCEESMEFGVYHFPDFPIPAGETHYSYLCKLCWDGARSLYRVITPTIMRRLQHELEVIDSLGFSQYFLLMGDIVRWARERGIRCAGRGSAADSIVTYVLRITEVDPIEHELLFERFLNPQRKGAPDIDIDFDANRRDEVINYVYERYGREHAAMVCTVYTLHARSAVRELGKALDFPPEDLDRFAKALPHTGAGRIRAALEKLPELRDSQIPAAKFATLLDLCEKVAGFPRHLSVHLGGMVVSRERLDELVPLEWSTKGVIVTQWDKDDVEEVGLVKMDLLSLKNLAAIEDTVQMLDCGLRGYPRSGWRICGLGDGKSGQSAIDALPLDDPKVYELLRSTRTIGVFQVESPGMRGLLGRLQPEEFEDLIAQISLFRPGPLTADMINPFVARRHGEEPVTYFHPNLEPILRRTYGVLLYQEQVLEIASALAGFDYGQADRLRRAMTTDRAPAEMEKIKQTFLDGCAAQGDVAPEVAERVWQALAAFAAYGFCKAHAAAFARTAYQTAYLKTYYPAHFFCGILNNQPMGFYSSHTILQEAKRMGIPILGIDINLSEADFTVESPEGK
jgi:error-prone DNA polymerase